MVYADKRVPEHLKDDPLLYGECLSGALYWNDFENLAKTVGFTEPRLVNSRAITIDNDKLAKRVADIKFTSATYRLFKADGLEQDAQDYNQSVTYLGTIAEYEELFVLDETMQFFNNKVKNVSGNTWRTLQQSRFKSHFLFHGNFDKHVGLFSTSDKKFDFMNDEKTQQAASCCAPVVKSKSSCC